MQWWGGLHPNILGADDPSGSSLDPKMRVALVVAMLALWVVSLYLLTLRYRIAQLRRRTESVKSQLRELNG